MTKFSKAALAVLLTLLGIITLVYFLAFKPALKTARDRARQKQCTGNLKIIGLGSCVSLGKRNLRSQITRHNALVFSRGLPNAIVQCVCRPGLILFL